ncbi:MAG: citramalate synthase [Oscillospiraceae bacterium]|jgi:2-isopropylmalate synthase|nr:citramalate synthase [Oscillospiraceae bacterium]
MKGAKLQIFDSTLRDGAQGEGVSFSVADKLKILGKLDDFGIDYVEAGNPGSNPKDLEFFKKASGMELKSVKLVAFGSTKRKNLLPGDDDNLKALIEANTDCIAIFGKSHDFHVDCILRVTLEENLAMIGETVEYLTGKGKTVFFDAEHFFDGYKSNQVYAMQTVITAAEKGAKVVVLCDTNGGCFPDEIAQITEKVRKHIKVDIGIHCHNDTGCAVANSIAAVKSGAVQVQGTFVGIGERCGNANLSVLIPNLQLKLGYSCVPEESAGELTETANFIAEVANIRLPRNLPYVGGAAFAHKGGMHADGVAKNPATFEHIAPETVGNERNFLLSEVSGRSALISKIKKIDPNLDKTDPIVRKLTDRIKELEHKGYQFEAADASFELLVLRELGWFAPYFEVVDFKIVSSLSTKASAMIKIRVDEKYEISADEGDGPVNAIDKALRKALEVFYPALGKVRLTDYKVRIINSGDNTAAVTRVLIESADGAASWTTVGASENIINASMTALLDSLEYSLYMNGERNYN